MTHAPSSAPLPWARIMLRANALLLGIGAVLLFLLPAGTILRDLADPAWRQPGTPAMAKRLFRSLTPRYAEWARSRLDSGLVATSTSDISGTEWPVFGSVFYLWAVESLQEAYEKDSSLFSEEPRLYAAEAIEQATRLVVDPGHAQWVKIHWGDNYLEEENLFYRALRIAAMTAHVRLTRADRYRAPLHKEAASLLADIDASRYGHLEDYPGECYPGDVSMSIYVLQRAGEILGMDTDAFVRRSLRGFEGEKLDKRGLVPYATDYPSGKALGPSRGCGNSYVSLVAPHLWPEKAVEWYDRFETHFWQTRWTAAGFREFPKDMSGYEWYMDVDAGPVMAGHGFAACAFGVGAARVNGRFDHAWPLASELLVAAWPLTDGSLLAPRFLSNATDAPYLGEAAILYVITRQPAPGVKIREGGGIPLFTWIVLAGYLVAGAVILWAARKQWLRTLEGWRMPAPKAQATIWCCLPAATLTAWVFGPPLLAALPLVLMLLFPRLTRVSDGKPTAA